MTLSRTPPKHKNYLLHFIHPRNLLTEPNFLKNLINSFLHIPTHEVQLPRDIIYQCKHIYLLQAKIHDIIFLLLPLAQNHRHLHQKIPQPLSPQIPQSLCISRFIIDITFHPNHNDPIHQLPLDAMNLYKLLKLIFQNPIMNLVLLIPKRYPHKKKILPIMHLVTRLISLFE
jgi:hypothetical protein